MDRETFRYLEPLYRAPEQVQTIDMRPAFRILNKWLESHPETAKLAELVRIIETDVSATTQSALAPPMEVDPTALEAFIHWANKRRGANTVIGFDVAAALVASALYEFAPIISQQRIAGKLSFRMTRDIASYAAWRNFSSFIDDEVSRTVSFHDKIESGVRNILDEAGESLKRQEEAAVSASERLVTFQTESAAALDSAKNIESALNMSKEIMENALTANEVQLEEIKAKAKLVEVQASAAIEAMLVDAAAKSGRTFWIDRAASSRKMLYFTASVLALCVLGLPGIAISNFDAVIAAIVHVNAELSKGLPAEPTATQLMVFALNRLLVFAIPVVIYFWMIRVLVRLTLHSVAAIEDAAQRHTVIDTFIHLLGKDVAKPEDRSKMFDAVFRPPVSLTGEATEPPAILNTIVEKIKPS